METPLLIEVIEDFLKPALLNRSLGGGSEDMIILKSGLELPMNELMSKRPSSLEGKNLQNSFILLNVAKDPEYSLRFLTDICSAFDSLIGHLPQHKASIEQSFLEALEELGDKYTSAKEFFVIVKAISVVKSSNANINDLMTSFYPHFSSMMHTYTVDINENLQGSFEKLEEMIKVLQNAESIGLSNENMNYMVLDNIFTYIEETIDYINIIQGPDARVENENSAILLGYAKQIKCTNDDFQRKLEELIKIVGIKELNVDNPDAIQPLEIQLEPVAYSNQPLPGLNEEAKAIYSYEHHDFHVEIKRATYRGERIAIKNYSKLSNKPWDPSKFYTEIQILEKCSRIGQELGRSSGFLKFYGAYMANDSISIYLEYLEEDLFKRIQALKDQRIEFTETEFKSIVTQLVEAFAALQRIGIMHQDIKPGNILINGKGEDVSVKIIDFGVSKFKRYGMATTQTADAVTTSYYRAPELVGKLQAIYNSFKADTYSLGLTFYEMYFLQDIRDINNPSKQNEVIKKLNNIRYYWLKNLLKNMMEDVSVRLTFTECIGLLPGHKTDPN